MLVDMIEGRLTGLSIMAALGVYVWTIFGLRTLMVREGRAWRPPEFKEAYSFGNWLIKLHITLSYLAFFGFMVGGPLLAGELLDKSIGVGVGAWLTVGGWNLFNGIFELVTGVCPVYGLLIKRHNRQMYFVGQAVRGLGVVRIALSVVIVGVCIRV
jgi:hypothetical protein